MSTVEVSEKKKILLIDDDQDILKMEKMLLSREGYEVDTAENGADAVKISEEKAFDLALIDIVLPDVQGTSLLDRLKNKLSVKMRKVMLTGNATLDNAVEALNNGAHAFLTKPIKTEELLATVKEQLQEQDDEYMTTQRKVAKFIEQNETDFVGVVKKSLDSVLGESGTQYTIFRLGGEKAISDPKVLAERLRSFFDEGADTILQQILKNLEGSQK